MILNELSLMMEDMSKDQVKTNISEFLKVCHKLSKKGKDNQFYYSKELQTEQLCLDYTIHDWLKDESVLKKDKDYFRKLINTGHLLDEQSFLESEMTVQSQGNTYKALGCLAAYEWDNYVVSVLSKELWNDEVIIGEYTDIENGSCFVDIKNCGTEEHVDVIFPFQEESNKIFVSTGTELWDKRELLFPHLIFCDSVKKQMEEANVSLSIQNILKRIQILEDYFSTYDGHFNKELVGHGCRYESESVQNDERYKKLRKFMTPYGTEEYFYWHISFSGNCPGRIHFIPDQEHNKGIIGYVGKHLPTPTYRTI